MRHCTHKVGEQVDFTTGDNPNALWPYTEWEKVEGVFALASSEAHVLGGIGGEAAHVLTVEQLPSHTHTQNAHNHTQNAHSHTVNGGGGASITGGSHTHRIADSVLCWVGSGGSYGWQGGSNCISNGAKGYTTNSTSHTHSVTGHTHACSTSTPAINNTTATNQNTGGGAAHNNMPPYHVVNRWKRVA